MGEAPKQAGKDSNRACKHITDDLVKQRKIHINMTCMIMVVADVFGWSCWSFMGVDGCSGTRLGVGARKGDKEGRRYTLWVVTAHDGDRKMRGKSCGGQRGRHTHEYHR